jgi:hypothetical protein
MQTLREKYRCELLQDAWKGIDSQLADNSAFDAGALYACQHILTALQNEADILDAIAELIGQVAELNDERGRD